MASDGKRIEIEGLETIHSRPIGGAQPAASADPRDLAAQWLIEVIARAGCADSIGFVFARADELVDAILDQPGVEVTIRYDCHTGADEVAVWLPIEPVEDDGAS